MKKSKDTIVSENSIHLNRNMMINNEINDIIEIHCKKGVTGYPIQLQLGGKCPKGWITLKDIRKGDQISVPISINLSFN